MAFKVSGALLLLYIPEPHSWTFSLKQGTGGETAAGVYHAVDLYDADGFEGADAHSDPW